MPRMAFYVDGFNLYHAIDALGRDRLKWLNLTKLAETFLKEGEVLGGVTYFTAFNNWEPDKSRRHREYIAALKAKDVDVVVSRFQKVSRVCSTYNRRCHFREEKQTDVEIALRVYRDANSGIHDRIVVVTADADQVPLVRALRTDFPRLAVEVAAPPGRRKSARELCDAASKHYEITEGRIGTCLLPYEVRDEDGRLIAQRPAKYG